MGVKDAPGLSLSSLVDGRLKTIITYDMEGPPVPPSLRKLGERFDAIVGSAPLVAGPAAAPAP